MIRSRKYQFMLVIISICIFSPILIAKSSEDETKLKFEINNDKSQLWLSIRRDTPGQGPIKPTHVAVLSIRRPNELSRGHEEIRQILNTSAGRSLSEQQRKFLSASSALTWLGEDRIRNHDMVFLYAVSQEDAKKTVQAYLEIPTNKVKARMQKYKEYIKDKKQEIIEIKKVLPEKQKQADEMQLKFIEIKNTRYFPLSDNDAYEKAKETILDMYKMLDILEIELAGIREKMSIINEYRKTPQDRQAIMRRNKLPEGMLAKLEQMFIEQTIELKSAEARKQAAIKIRGRDKAFIDMFNEWNNLSDEVYKLKANLESAEKNVQRIEEILTNPTPNLLPPEIYQNKVTIYPVRAE